ncbi:MAG: AAA family ATPase [Chloroflexota bacterium]
MIIWINGAFGAGKTTTSELLHQQLPEAHLFDPEIIGHILQKTFPAVRRMDYQDLQMWRKLVIQFINEALLQFPQPLIIPMTLVVPDYLNEIFSEVSQAENPFLHFFLQTSKEELTRRINNQVIVDDDLEQDARVRQWRLDQIDRCISAEKKMPQETIFLNTVTLSPDQLVQQMLLAFDNHQAPHA